MALREYQKEAVAKTFAAMQRESAVVLQMATGGGKTHVASDIIERGLKRGRRVCFIVDRITLVNQTVKRFWEQGIRVGVIQGDHPDYDPSQPVQVCSVQTLRRRPKHLWPKSDLYIVDECHDQYQVVRDIMEMRPFAKYLGLSATPWSTGMARTWKELVVGATTSQLIDLGYLSPYKAYGPDSPNMGGARIYGGDWALEEAAERMEPLTGDIVTHYKTFASNKKAVVFCVNVAHAKKMAREFVRQGVSADYVSGKDSPERRQEVLGNFDSGDIKVLCNCDVLTKGYDSPDIEVGILARPTRSLSVHIQMCGRVIRKHPDIKEKLILDHAGNIARLGFPDDPLPEAMCDKEKGVSLVDRRRKDAPEPWRCVGCNHMNPPDERVCQQCGGKNEAAVSLPDSVDGVLTALSRENRADKQTVYAMLNYIRTKKGYQRGWADHSYKDLFGVWPNNKINKNMTVRPSREMNKWVDERLSNRRKHYFAKNRARS